MDYDIKKLYTDKLDAYLSFSSFFRYPQGLEAFFKSFERLREGLRILDSGCGTGFASFALESPPASWAPFSGFPSV